VPMLKMVSLNLYEGVRERWNEKGGGDRDMVWSKEKCRRPVVQHHRMQDCTSYGGETKLGNSLVHVWIERETDMYNGAKTPIEISTSATSTAVKRANEPGNKSSTNMESIVQLGEVRRM